jgi:WD40 repeat protein
MSRFLARWQRFAAACATMMLVSLVSLGCRDRSALAPGLEPIGPVSHLAFSADGGTVNAATYATTGAEEVGHGYLRHRVYGLVSTWDVSSGQAVLSARGDQRVFQDWTGTSLMIPSVGQPRVSPDGRRVVVSVRQRTGTADFRVWDRATGQSLPGYSGVHNPLGKAVPLAFDADGHLVVTHAGDSVVICDEPQTRWLKLKGVNGSLSQIAVSSDGRRLAGAWMDGGELKELGVWEMATGDKLFGVRPRLQYVRDLLFSPDDAFVVGTGAATATVVWQAATGAEFRVLHDCSKAVFSQDSHLLAGVTSDTTVTVWDLLTGEDVCSREHDGSPVTALAFDGAGKRLVTGCEDGNVRVWAVP